MIEDGNYPFKVNVRNIFTGDRKLQVTYHFKPCVKIVNPGQELLDMKFEEQNYEIDRDQTMQLPLYRYVDYLQIRPGGPAPDGGGKYTIWCGEKALARLYKGKGAKGKDIVPSIVASAGAEVKDGQKYYLGAGWVLEDNEHSWTLEIRKQLPDPEEENVSIGEDPPV